MPSLALLKNKKMNSADKVYKSMLDNPTAMRRVIQTFLNRRKLSLSKPLADLSDKNVKKVFIHIWEEVQKGPSASNFTTIDLERD